MIINDALHPEEVSDLRAAKLIGWKAGLGELN